MRNRVLTMLAALLLSSHLGMAQTALQTPTPTPTPAPAPTMPTLGIIDFGGFFGDVDGDEARYERYRDTRNGLFSYIDFAKDTADYHFDAMASHIGYRDQRYEGNYANRRVKFSFLYDWTPPNYSYDSRTEWVTNGNTLTLDQATRAAVQGPTNAANDGTAVGTGGRSLRQDGGDRRDLRRRRRQPTATETSMPQTRIARATSRSSIEGIRTRTAR